MLHIFYQTNNYGGIKMERKLSWYEAISFRTSRRSYTGAPLDPNQLHAIQQTIATINKESGLNFQLLEDSSQFFSGFKRSYGMLKNVQSVIALVGNKKTIPNTHVQIGYYGEFLMLECVSHNLGTCWVGGTYDKKATESVLNLKEDEELFAVITVGEVANQKTLKEKLIAQLGKNKQSVDELLLEKEEPVPTWVLSGIDAARLAPSAVNGKPIGYSYVKETVKAFITKKNHAYEAVDLGISLAHFELGALNEGVSGEWVPETEADEKKAFIFKPNQEY